MKTLMDYNNKIFKPIKTSSNGEVTIETEFLYQQKGNIVTCTYSGGGILRGHLIGIVNENGTIQMNYHQVNSEGELQAGVCFSTPEVLENGKIRLYESWKWTTGDKSSGESILEEI